MTADEAKRPSKLDGMIEALILESIGSKNPDMAATGRLLATGVIKTVKAWYDDERERRTEPTSMALAIIKLASCVTVLGVTVAKPGKEIDMANALAEMHRKQVVAIAEAYTEAQALVLAGRTKEAFAKFGG